MDMFAHLIMYLFQTIELIIFAKPLHRCSQLKTKQKWLYIYNTHIYLTERNIAKHIRNIVYKRIIIDNVALDAESIKDPRKSDIRDGKRYRYFCTKSYVYLKYPSRGPG